MVNNERGDKNRDILHVFKNLVYLYFKHITLFLHNLLNH